MAISASDIWKKYIKGKNHHSAEDLYAKTRKCFRFAEGDQWSGMEGGERLPVLNFIAPVVDYKTAMVSMQNMQIVFTPEDSVFGENAADAEKLCEDMTVYANQRWEALEMDYLCWKIVRDACIAGDSYIYFYNRSLGAQLLDNTAVYFADEMQEDIQKQRYIIVYERKPVEDIRDEAKRNRISKEQIAQIVSDAETDTVVTDEISSSVSSGEDGKCGSLMYLWRGEDGYIHIIRTTKNVIYQPDTAITGMTRYPIVPFVWSRRKNSSRGIGEVWPMIPNQIEANRLLVRRLISAKMNAFAKPVYVKNLIDNPSDVDRVGTAIEVKSNSASSVRDVFSYVAPAPMSAEAGNLQNEVISQTRMLAGAGDATLGQTNPEKASGAAILAVQDQASIPLNEQVAMFRKFVEDIALCWLDIWRAYNPDGMQITVESGDGYRRDTIPRESFDLFRMRVRIDATQTTPFSKYARAQSLENALARNMISFEEYVDALDSSSSAPKAKFEKILSERKKAQDFREAEQNPQTPSAPDLTQLAPQIQAEPAQAVMQ